MSIDEVKRICEDAGLQFVNRSYGRTTTKTVTLGALVAIVNEALKSKEDPEFYRIVGRRVKKSDCL